MRNKHYCSAMLWLILAAVLPGAAAAQTPSDSLAISLDDAVTQALRSGDEARLAEAQVEIADAQVSVARAAALPQLRLLSTFNHGFENARAQAVGQIFNQPNTYNTNINLSQSIFQGGRVFAGARAASHTREAAKETQRETRTGVALDVVRSYMQVLLTKRLLDIQAANYELATSQLEQVEQLERAGRAARFDVLRARVDRANLEPLVIQTSNDHELALLDLKRLINVPIRQPLKLLTTIDAARVEELAAEIAGQPGDGGQRPALHAAELTARARRDAVAVARADLLPTVSVFLQSGYQAFPVENRFPFDRGRIISATCPTGSDPTRSCTAQNGGWFSDRTFGVNINWPLFDGLRAKSNLNVAQAQARSADLQLAQQREAIAIEVARSRANFDRARSLFAARRQNSGEAEEAFRLASLRFSRGLSTQLDVSAAQLALLTAQTNEARATYELYTPSGELARALGKPIPGVGDLDSPARDTR
jgi:outer membrane protein TolC